MLTKIKTLKSKSIYRGKYSHEVEVEVDFNLSRLIKISR